MGAPAHAPTAPCAGAPHAPRPNAVRSARRASPAGSYGGPLGPRFGEQPVGLLQKPVAHDGHRMRETRGRPRLQQGHRRGQPASPQKLQLPQLVHHQKAAARGRRGRGRRRFPVESRARRGGRIPAMNRSRRRQHPPAGARAFPATLRARRDDKVPAVPHACRKPVEVRVHAGDGGVVYLPTPAAPPRSGCRGGTTPPAQPGRAAARTPRARPAAEARCRCPASRSAPHPPRRSPARPRPPRARTTRRGPARRARHARARQLPNRPIQPARLAYLHVARQKEQHALPFPHPTRPCANAPCHCRGTCAILYSSKNKFAPDRQPAQSHRRRARRHAMGCPERDCCTHGAGSAELAFPGTFDHDTPWKFYNHLIGGIPQGHRGTRLLPGHALVLRGGRLRHGRGLHHARRGQALLRAGFARAGAARGGRTVEVVVFRGGQPGRGGAERLVRAPGTARPAGRLLRRADGVARRQHPQGRRVRAVPPAGGGGRRRARRRRARRT